MRRRPSFVDVTGLRFGRLTVVVYHGHLVCPGGSWRHAWLCHCECGNHSVVATTPLLRGRTQSCGCLARERTRERYTKHGMHLSAECASGSGARDRCNDPGGKDYPRYGGRGIRMCARWSSFENFLADMGSKPSPNHSLDRIDVDGHYSPDNCRWATTTEQCNNKRNNVHLTAFGETMTLSEWARYAGMSVAALRTRVFKYNWDVEVAVSEPLAPRRRRRLTESRIRATMRPTQRNQ